MFLIFSVPQASNVFKLFLFLYRIMQENAIICMNWQFGAENVLNFFLILGDFEAHVLTKLFLYKKKSVSEHSKQ